jgi:glucan phosphoethanolaminetransferase (alkaline phosphatase superfamily)
MPRIIAGIIVGWIVMAVLVMATFGITMTALGLERILQPDSYWTTDTFNIIVLVGGFIGAIIGGAVCKLIARNSNAAFALAAIVLAMGVGSIVMNMNKPDPPARTAPATMQDIRTHGKEPTWFAIGKTAAGALGVLIGGSLVKKRTRGGS